jgi:predicted transcriptional regulator
MQFLVDNSAYDCMPRNSLICAVEKDIKIVDAIELLISEKAEELLIWDNKLV